VGVAVEVPCDDTAVLSEDGHQPLVVLLSNSGDVSGKRQVSNWHMCYDENLKRGFGSGYVLEYQNRYNLLSGSTYTGIAYEPIQRKHKVHWSEYIVNTYIHNFKTGYRVGLNNYSEYYRNRRMAKCNIQIAGAAIFLIRVIYVYL